MIRMINVFTKTEMWVADDRVDEYKAAGHTLAADLEKPEVEVDEIDFEEPEVEADEVKETKKTTTKKTVKK